MTFTHFEITECTATGKVEVVGEQGTLWAGTWPRPSTGAASGCLCDGEHVCGGENATARQQGRPSLRLIKGGKA